MERQRRHRLDFGKIDLDHAVIKRALLRLEPPVCIRPAVRGQIFLYFFVRLPDGGQARRLSGHDVDADAVVHRELRNTGACKFQHTVFYKAVVIHRAAQRDGHIVRAHTAVGRTGEIHQHDLRHGDIICIAEQLLDNLRAALAHAHRAQRAVARMAVGAQDHAPAAGHHLSCVLVDDRLIGRHIDAAVFLRRGQAEHVVVLIDRAAHSAEAVVAVGHHIRHWKARKTAGLGRLDNADIGDVV